MNWKGCRNKLSLPILRHFPGILLASPRKTTIDIREDVLDRDARWEPPEYNSEALLLEPIFPVEFTNIQTLFRVQIRKYVLQNLPLTFNCHTDTGFNFMNKIYNFDELLMYFPYYNP
jgi:hypothetical protein